MIAITPIDISVLAALRACGRRNAVTPFEIASTPVSALQPEANARSSTTMPDPGRETNGRRVGDVGSGPTVEQAAHETDGDHGADRDDEAVGRQREHESRLPHAAQVDDHEYDEHAETELDARASRAPARPR